MPNRHALRFLLVLAASLAAGTCIAQDIDAACPGAAAWIKAKQAHSAKKQPITASNKVLHDKILAMENEDEAMRNKLIADQGRSKALLRELVAADARHLKELRIIAPDGTLPTLRQVGTDGMQALLLLVQHADSDPAYQQAVLNKLHVRVKAGDVDGRAYAFLTDRVLRATHKPQRYGTQMIFVQNHLVLPPVENPSGLGARRQDVGLMPMRDYECVMSAEYKMPLAGSSKP